MQVPWGSSPNSQRICSCESSHHLELVDLTLTAAGRGERPLGATHSHLPISQGKPKPQAIWTRDGCALDASRVSVRNGERDSILFIREAQRTDSGRYQLSLRLGGLEATATIDILVIGTVGEWETGWSSGLPLQPEWRESWGSGTGGRSGRWREGWHSSSPFWSDVMAREAVLFTVLLGPFREAGPSSEHQVGGCLGLQRYPGVDSSPRHGQCGPPGIHGAEG